MARTAGSRDRWKQEWGADRPGNSSSNPNPRAPWVILWVGTAQRRHHRLDQATRAVFFWNSHVAVVFKPSYMTPMTPALGWDLRDLAQQRCKILPKRPPISLSRVQAFSERLRSTPSEHWRWTTSPSSKVLWGPSRSQPGLGEGEEDQMPAHPKWLSTLSCWATPLRGSSFSWLCGASSVDAWDLSSNQSTPPGCGPLVGTSLTGDPKRKSREGRGGREGWEEGGGKPPIGSHVIGHSRNTRQGRKNAQKGASTAECRGTGQRAEKPRRVADGCKNFAPSLGATLPGVGGFTSSRVELAVQISGRCSARLLDPGS